MAGSDSAKLASTKRTDTPGDDGCSALGDAAAKKVKVDDETAAPAEQKESDPPPHDNSASAGLKASRAANADAKAEANGDPVDGGGAAEPSHPSSPSSKSSSSSASSSSTDPACKDLETHLNNVFLILKTALKVLDIAGQDGCSFAEAMPPVPGWADAGKVILLDVLHRYGGEGKGGRQVELLKRMAREATEVMAIVEREGRGEGGSVGDGNNEEEEEEEGEGEGVELAEWVE